MPNKPLCIIPARGGSKRFPRKNVALLAGKPLLAYAITAAQESDVFDTVCVSSEDREILQIAQRYDALALERPAELAGDRVQVIQVCIHALEHFAAQGRPFSEFGVLLPTSPFRTAEDVKAAYEILRREDANYVMSLTPYSHPPQRAVWAPQGYVEPYFGLKYMKQTQLLDSVYRHDGAVIFAKTEVFLRERQFYGSNVAPYFIPPERTVDIDSALDLAFAEFLMTQARQEVQRDGETG